MLSDWASVASRRVSSPKLSTVISLPLVALGSFDFSHGSRGSQGEKSEAKPSRSLIQIYPAKQLQDPNSKTPAKGVQDRSARVRTLHCATYIAIWQTHFLNRHKKQNKQTNKQTRPEASPGSGPGVYP